MLPAGTSAPRLQWRVAGGKPTVLRHLQDVADQGAVAVEGLGPCQVDGPPFRGAESRRWVLRGMRQLSGGERQGTPVRSRSGEQTPRTHTKLP